MADQTISTITEVPRPEASSSFAQVAVLAALAATGTLATNILLPSLPQMAAALKVSTAAVTSAITVFLAVFALGQLLVGPISDRFGRRWPVLIGFAVFFAGSVWCALANDLRWARVRPRCCRARLPATCFRGRRSDAPWR
jgi:DHA1 family bicyclomycin/chloramphenicol resistance-like MFS transporter